MEVVVRRYLTRMERLGRSEQTIALARRVLLSFARSVDATDPRDVTDDDVEDWLESCCSHLAASSRRTYLDILRAFFTHLAKRGKVDRHPVEALGVASSPRRRPTYYSSEQVSRVIEKAACGQDRVLFTVMARHGQRVRSVLRLRWQNVDFERACIRYPPIKGGEGMTLPLDRDTAKLLRAHQALVGQQPFVFPGRTGRDAHISYSAVVTRLRAACKAAGVPYRGCHEFRRTLVTTLLQQGARLDVVSKRVAGHASIQTTVAYYAGADDDDVAGLIRALPY